MTFNYPHMATTATRLMAKFGETGTFARHSVTGGGPADQTGGVAGDTGYAATLVTFPITARNIGLGVGETNLRETDLEFYMSVGVTVPPIAGDVITIAGGRFMILSCVVIAPAGVGVVYTGFARNYGAV
jgi:hypothetical protein